MTFTPCALTYTYMYIHVLKIRHVLHTYRHIQNTHTHTHTKYIQMKRNKIKFQIISPPSEDEIISAVLDHACARLSKVNEKTMQATKHHAEKVIDAV